jgi:lipoprotein signal peptidase
MTMREKGILFGGSFLLFLSLVGIRTSLRGDHLCNTEVGFGLFPYTESFLLLGLLLSVFICYLICACQRFSLKLVFSILLVGSVANLFERFYFGCVLDYLVLPFIGSHINIADVLITVSLGYLFFFLDIKDFKK